MTQTRTCKNAEMSPGLWKTKRLHRFRDTCYPDYSLQGEYVEIAATEPHVAQRLLSATGFFFKRSFCFPFPYDSSQLFPLNAPFAALAERGMAQAPNTPVWVGATTGCRARVRCVAPARPAVPRP
jgi:hypothetical protein